MSTLQNAYAAGTINTSRFVVASTTHPNAAIQATDGTKLVLGISTNASRRHPDPEYTQTQIDEAAIQGEVIGIHPPGTVGVDLLCNVAWNPGDLLMPDANGMGIVATTGKYYGARAQTAGTVGALCPVDVVCGLTP
ncbi:MAG: hypothetical protein JSS49_19005 [Planctomycetes bacterium]|nr:hypothetical protein [Planctomycetota bacterium]